MPFFLNIIGGFFQGLIKNINPLEIFKTSKRLLILFSMVAAVATSFSFFANFIFKLFGYIFDIFNKINNAQGNDVDCFYYIMESLGIASATNSFLLFCSSMLILWLTFYIEVTLIRVSLAIAGIKNKFFS